MLARLLKSLGCVAGLLSSVGTAYGFGGEDMARGLPWHHEDITVFALSGDDPYYPNDARFEEGAAKSIAWHADNIDSYLYNPLFWARGTNPDERTQAALVGFENLAKLHFDDTFTTDGIQANWQRYAAGTLTGLYWASLQGEDGDLAAGHNILGVSFHAVQDFYSHSNWVTDTRRRCFTYFETEKDYRNGVPLYSGVYEAARSGAQDHHGAYSFSCSIFAQEAIRDPLDIVCSGYSPMQNASMCDSFRACRGAQAIDVQLKSPLPLPNSATIYLEPKGIALDNTHMSKAQAKHRNLVDERGDFREGRDGMHFTDQRCPDIIRAKETIQSCDADTERVFAGVKDLAIRATIEWAEYLEEAMTALGDDQRRYWNRLKSSSSWTEDNIEAAERQFETFSQLPYQFLAAGPYPVGNPRVQDRATAHNSNGWYLRMRIRTADEWFAGTNADIYADVKTANGVESFRLDYLPHDDQEGRTNSAILIYNDFETGRDDVYTIGPVTSGRPVSVTLRNEDKGAGDVFEAIYNDLVNGIDHTLTDLRQFVIGFIGGNADYVGQKVKAYRVEDLRELGLFGSDKLEVRGGDEGDHDVLYNIIQRPDLLTRKQREDGYIAVRIALRDLHTINESKVDRGTDSDEPFVLFQVTPLSGREGEESFAYVSPPFEDMDDDEKKPFPLRSQLYKEMILPPEGMVVVAAKIFESDSENQFDRNTMLREFVTNLDEATQRPAGEFLDALNASIAEDWTPQDIDIFAFQRGRYPMAGQVLERTSLEEIEGGETSDELVLRWNKLVDLLKTEAVLDVEREHPDANQVLEGIWYSNAYWCGETQKYQKVEIKTESEGGNTITATKLEADGDECVGAGDVTFEGEFENGVITGKRHIVPPPYERRKSFVYPDGDSQYDPIPDYADPDIHPRLDLEGNWQINWANAEVPSARAVLSKGGEWACKHREDPQGCWYAFYRNPTAEWQIRHYSGPGSAGTSSSVDISPGGQMKIKWGYYTLGHWGGNSQLAASSDNRISGNWTYGEDEGGGENWERVHAKVTHIGTVKNGETTRVRLGETLTLDTKYVNHVFSMRGNRSTVYLDLYGENMWGLHRYHIPWLSDIEIARPSYICAPGSEYAMHLDWQVCESGGGTIGMRFPLNIWTRAESKEHTLFFDDQEIKFTLNVEGEPERDPHEQPMRMGLMDCGELEELDRDWQDHPFRLVRHEIKKD